MNQLEVDEIPKKRLIIRLSSLGDVILSTSALETLGVKKQQFDWVVSAELAPLLRGHPRLQRLWTFDRAGGLSVWIRLCRNLWEEQYTDVADLHASLRTRILKILFRFWSLSERKTMPRWQRIRKSRWRLQGYFVFKKFWPRGLRPRPMVERFARAVGGDGSERPNLSYLVHAGKIQIPQPYICVMPGAAWPGKRWPVQNYVKVLRRSGITAVILGSQNDTESLALVREMESNSLTFVSGVGKWSLLENAEVLARSRGYLGNDTGMAHLAQALGVPATVVMGPTVSDMGFGPWQAGSASVSASLWCSPCGKDGRFCFRLTNRYACMSRLHPEAVVSSTQRFF